MAAPVGGMITSAWAERSGTGWGPGELALGASRFTAPIWPEPFLVVKHYTTRELLDEREIVAWDLAEVEAFPDEHEGPATSRAYLMETLRALNAELARRKRLVGRPHAPAWPAAPPDRTELYAAIKARLPLAECLWRHQGVNFERRGDELVARCPFPDHEDNTPSFRVHPDKQVFYCFGCHRGGDLFAFYREWWQEPRLARVVEALAEMAGVSAKARYVTLADGALRRIV